MSTKLIHVLKGMGVFLLLYPLAEMNAQTGNVGIGTTTPTEKLEVAGNILTSTGIVFSPTVGAVTSASHGNTIKIQAGKAGGGLGYQINSSGGNLNGGSLYLEAGGASHFAKGGDIFLLAGDAFDNGSTGGSIFIKSAGYTNTGTPGYIAFSTAGSYPMDLNNPIERMRVAGNGNIGISTTTPTEKLEISNGNILVNSGGSTPGAYAVKSNTYASAAGTPLIQNQGSGRLLVSSPEGSKGIDFAMGGTPVMVIDNNGRVGIGTTAPNSSNKLEVWNGNISVSNGGVYSNTGYWGDVLRTNWGNDLLLQSTYADKGILFRTQSGEKMRITATGNVGIGKSNPSYMLDVSGDISSAGTLYATSGIITATTTPAVLDVNGIGNSSHIRLFSGQDNSQIFLSDYAGTMGIQLWHTGKAFFAGNVGIGTQTPSSMLDVNGVINATGGNSTNWNTAYSWGNHTGLYKSFTWLPSWTEVTDKPVFAAVAYTGNYNDIIDRPTNVSAFINDAAYLTNFTEVDPKIGANTIGYTPKWDGTALVTGALFQDESGNVGINTSTPLYKLDVNGDLNIAGQVKIQGGSPGVNKILTSDASGLAVWANATFKEAALITKDDFSGTPLKNYWATQITGGATISITNSAATLSTNGGNTAKLYSTKQKSVSEGTLVFKAVTATYEDNNNAYGPLVRGLVNGTNRNNAIEFINISGNTLQARTVSGGVATTTNYATGASLWNYFSYTIIASSAKVEFYFDGILIATHTTNIPTVALNMYFDASTPGGNVPHYVDDAEFEIIR